MVYHHHFTVVEEEEEYVNKTWVIEDDRPDMNGRHKDTQHGDVIAFLRSVGAPE